MAAENRFLARMLDRLFASVVNGPGLNCRPHASRQRVDWAHLSRLGDLSPDAALKALLGDKRSVRLTAKVRQPPVPPPEKRSKGNKAPAPDSAADDAGESNDKPAPADPARRAQEAWALQQALLAKLRTIVEDARTYEQDTGVHVLRVGFPLLSMPALPGAGDSGGPARRILAPIAFIPVSVTIKKGLAVAIEIACKGETIDRVVPNDVLLAWLESRTGQQPGELFDDPEGNEPWHEIAELTRWVAKAIELPEPEFLNDWPKPKTEAQPQVLPPTSGSLSTATTEPSSADSATADSEPINPADVPFTPPPATPLAQDDQRPPTSPAPDATPAAEIDPVETPVPWSLMAAPTTDDSDQPGIIPCAVLGLFPIARQGLLRDMQALAGGEPMSGPVLSFMTVNVGLDELPDTASPAYESSPAIDAEAAGIEELPLAIAAVPSSAPAPQQPSPGPMSSPSADAAAPSPRNIAEERLVAVADPCQARAVRLASQCQGLVIHGPPGTGKSQTITNIIGEHLSRGQRVLFVCDKRTALDVVHDRLAAMGLADLCAVVHDPQRDQRELYKSIRIQIEELAEAAGNPAAAARLAKIDTEMISLHRELTEYRNALFDGAGGSSAAAAGAATDGAMSFHAIVGQWLDALLYDGPSVDAASLAGVTLEEFQKRTVEIRDVLTRGSVVNLPDNPWRDRLGVTLTQFLSRPMDEYRMAIGSCVRLAAAADAAASPAIVGFNGTDLIAQGQAREQLAGRLQTLLTTVAPAALTNSAERPIEQIRAAREAITAAEPFLKAMRVTHLDPVLLERERTHPMSIADAERAWKVLRHYSRSYRTWADRLAEVRRRALDAPTDLIERWMHKPADAVARAARTLDELAPLADAIGAASLDRELLGPARRDPLPITRVIEWLGAIGEYHAVAGKWYAPFAFSRRNRATPVARFFGLPLTLETAGRMQTFLRGLRQRMELAADLESSILPAAYGKLPDDDQLLTDFTLNRSVVKAVAALPAESTSEPQTSGVLEEDAPTLLTGVNDPPVIDRLIGEAARPVATVLGAFELPLGLEGAERLRAFVGALHTRLHLQRLCHQSLRYPAPSPPMLESDEILAGSIADHRAIFDLLIELESDELLAGMAPHVRRAMANPTDAGPFIDGLHRSTARAQTIFQLTDRLESAGLLDPAWLAEADRRLRAGALLGEEVGALSDRIDTVEHILRIRQGLARLGGALAVAVEKLVQSCCDCDAAMGALARVVLSAEINRRLRSRPILQDIDGHHIRTSFDRYRRLDEEKRQRVREVIRDQWLTRQKQRLVAPSGSRLNSAGAEMKRRLIARGERGTRLRQAVAAGRLVEGGDPLFDLRPVWMASPETVAQIFPRQALFDIVIFDEASQCRLEEAIPVLTRARRVTIAGDPRQLPPTRFFESAVAASEEPEPQTDQELFEQQQSRVEDLLGAALNLEIRPCYLDVHYRSRNSDLIAFSNAEFYGSRLQPIPGHPSRRARYAPVTLYTADGVYENRVNEIEAQQVCQIVRDLLKRAQPPSIGIACFNMPQRDLIVEALDDAAAEDPEFARRLDEARQRRGPDAFEGLFVKNLENVQGDERDHIIISTTYGPDPRGKFYRRFGPLTTPGGGRRLNVLVTRAREEVHVVTSIPAAERHSLPPIPAGLAPTGGWLLFAYLNWAEKLAAEYDVNHRILSSTAPSEKASVFVGPSRCPSAFAEALARRLAQRHNVGSYVNWGNDGFGIDVALQDPACLEDVTIGILADSSRFPAADDPVEWDMFRTAIHESQGWTLQRLWTPHFYRDPQGTIAGILKKAAALARERAAQRDTISVVPEG
jgi:hypothetical protein